MSVGRGEEPALHILTLALAFLAIACLGFFVFPGHTILQSDTQIYIPMLEHVRDPSVLARDPMAVVPHLSYTIYDEIALSLVRVTGATFEQVLSAQQFVYRLLAIAATYSLARACALSSPFAMLVAAVLSLGATLLAPAVLTVEYEPVPRGFSLPFVLASMAAVCFARNWIATLSAGFAVAMHPPTALAFAGFLALYLLRKKEWLPLFGFLPGAAALAFSAATSATSGSQPLFGSIDPALEQILRFRAAYNWVSIWVSSWAMHYLLIAGVLAVGLRALWGRLPHTLRWFGVGLPVLGVLSVPVSFLLLEQSKWIGAPQYQPARYLLFLTYFALFVGLCAGVHLTNSARWRRAFMLFAAVFYVTLESRLTWFDPEVSPWRLAAALLLAGVCVFSSVLTEWRRFASIGLASVLPFFVVPQMGQVRNFPALHSPELDQLSEWAKRSTPVDSVFQFAGVGRNLQPGVFRARARRALYNDWKSGGHANFNSKFARLWWERWTRIQSANILEDYSRLGIEFLVYTAQGDLPARAPVYKNARFVVYDLRNN